MKPLIIHVHISKTGGSTLGRDILKRVYGPKSLFVSGQDDKQTQSILHAMRKHHNVSSISAHLPYGHIQRNLSKLKLNRQIFHITMLREPIDRYVSLYYYARKYAMKHNITNSASELTLEEYAERGFSANEQTIFIAGEPDINLAKRNLTNDIIFGLTERFHDSILMMKNKFNWQIDDYTSKNINKDRPSVAEISPDTIELIKKNLDLDTQLYEYAVRLFNARITTNTKKRFRRARSFAAHRRLHPRR